MEQASKSDTGREEGVVGNKDLCRFRMLNWLFNCPRVSAEVQKMRIKSDHYPPFKGGGLALHCPAGWVLVMWDYWASGTWPVELRCTVLNKHEVSKTWYRNICIPFILILHWNHNFGLIWINKIIIKMYFTFSFDFLNIPTRRL